MTLGFENGGPAQRQKIAIGAKRKKKKRSKPRGVGEGSSRRAVVLVGFFPSSCSLLVCMISLRVKNRFGNRPILSWHGKFKWDAVLYELCPSGRFHNIGFSCFSRSLLVISFSLSLQYPHSSFISRKLLIWR